MQCGNCLSHFFKCVTSTPRIANFSNALRTEAAHPAPIATDLRPADQSSMPLSFLARCSVSLLAPPRTDARPLPRRNTRAFANRTCGFISDMCNWIYIHRTPECSKSTGFAHIGTNQGRCCELYAMHLECHLSSPLTCKDCFLMARWFTLKDGSLTLKCWVAF